MRVFIILFTMAILCIMLVAPKKPEVAEVVKEYAATCHLENGEVYYNKKVKDYWRVGGATQVILSDGKHDVISGNCKLEEL